MYCFFCLVAGFIATLTFLCWLLVCVVLPALGVIFSTVIHPLNGCNRTLTDAVNACVYETANCYCLSEGFAGLAILFAASAVCTLSTFCLYRLGRAWYTPEEIGHICERTDVEYSGSDSV